jgi:RNA polymerase sigma factor (sigma-70 family)
MTATLVSRAADAFEAYQGGDRASFDDLVTMLTPLLWHTVRGTGIDPVAAEDVVQTTWMRLLHSSASVRDPQTVVKWLLTAVKREAWRVGKRARVEMLKTASLVGDEGDEIAGLPAREDQVPDELVFQHDRQRRLWGHIEALSPRCRELLRVIAFADRPDYALIAESLGMPIGSIGPTRGRCLAKLRQDLAADPQWEGRAS